MSYLTEFTSVMFVSGLSLNSTDMIEVPPLLLSLAGFAVQVFHNVTVILGSVPPRGTASEPRKKVLEST